MGGLERMEEEANSFSLTFAKQQDPMVTVPWHQMVVLVEIASTNVYCNAAMPGNISHIVLLNWFLNPIVFQPTLVTRKMLEVLTALERHCHAELLHVVLQDAAPALSELYYKWTTSAFISFVGVETRITWDTHKCLQMRLSIANVF